jgi:hypothetical protein
MRLDVDDDVDDDDDDATTAFGRTSSSPRRPRGRSFFFARGVLAVALVSFFTSVVALCGSAVARVADRAGKGGVGYSRRDATFVGETARELRFAVAKSSRRTRARLERSFAHAQTVLMETFVAVAEMRLGRAAAALAAGARKIETSASFASLAQVCVLSHLLYESAEQVARFLENNFELELESPDPSRRAGSPSPPSGPSSSIDHEFLAGIPWLALVSAALVTLALHGVAPRRCVALALAQDAAFGPTLGAARASARACLFPFRTGDKVSEVGAVGDALLLALKRLACWRALLWSCRACAAASGRACGGRSPPARSTVLFWRATTTTTTMRMRMTTTATSWFRARATDRRKRRPREES